MMKPTAKRDKAWWTEMLVLLLAVALIFTGMRAGPGSTRYGFMAGGNTLVAAIATSWALRQRRRRIFHGALGVAMAALSIYFLLALGGVIEPSTWERGQPLPWVLAVLFGAALAAGFFLMVFGDRRHRKDEWDSHLVNRAVRFAFMATLAVALVYGVLEFAGAPRMPTFAIGVFGGLAFVAGYVYSYKKFS
jgi:hypothetical protein